MCVLIAYRYVVYTQLQTHTEEFCWEQKKLPKEQKKKQAWILPFPAGSCWGAAFDPTMSLQLKRTISSCVFQGKKVKFPTISTYHQRKVGRSSRRLTMKGMLKLLVFLFPINVWNSFSSGSASAFSAPWNIPYILCYKVELD